MNTLEAAPVAQLLERLFMEADAATMADPAAFTVEEADRLVNSKTEYRRLYGMMKDLWLPVSRNTGSLIYILARNMRATAIVEFGTSFGISSIFLAAALRDNGGGRLITTEFEPSKVKRARQHLTEAGLVDLVDMREGDALATLAADLPPAIDLLLLDGAKALYADILTLVESRLRPGALIVADDADLCPDYIERIRRPGGGYMSNPCANDIELSMRL